MSQTNEFVDPRSEIVHSLDEGQVYEDKRSGDELVLVFLSEDAALLKDENRHRLETREDFEKNVGSGRYDIQADVDGQASTSAKVTKLNSLLEQYEESGGRKAAHKATAIEEAIELIENNGRPDDHETIDFESIRGIGSKAASSLRREGFSTKGDVRSADRDDILSVPNMGESNTDNLLESVEQ